MSRAWVLLVLWLTSCTPLAEDEDGGADGSAVDAGPSCQLNEERTEAGACERVEVVDLASSEEHACVVLSNHQVVCWGRNMDNQLGREATTDSELPGRVLGIDSADAVVAGPGGTCAILESGLMECWGRPNSGRFGSSALGRHTLGAGGVTHASIGFNHTCWVETGRVFCVGLNGAQQLGFAGDQTDPPRPAALSREDFVGVVAGPSVLGYTCAWTAGDGLVYCFGSGNGPLGRAATDTANPPALVDGLDGVVDMAAMPASVCALRSNGTVACWGENSQSQLGHPFDGLPTSVTPVDLGPGLPDTGLSSISVGSAHMLGVAADTSTLQVYGWGENVGGQLGTSEPIRHVAPRSVYGRPGEISAAWVDGGSAFSCVGYRLPSMHTEVRCAGGNDNHQLGVEGPSRPSFEVVPPFGLEDP